MSEPKIKRNAEGELLVERFSRVRRIEHTAVVVTFILLILTGVPQKFDGRVSAFILGLFGGLDNARWVHRAAGIGFTVHALLHMGAFVVGVLMGKMRPTLVPTIQDLRDTRNNLLYYFGFREHPPALPKYDYRQKFEYIGLILGGLVMIFSGLVLLFPQLTAEVLPGQVIPAAQMMHTNEAMLALLVLVVWHTYGAVLSPEVFPLDTSVFTGYMPVHELKERHYLEYKRLFPNGEPAHEKPEAPAAPPPAPSASPELKRMGRAV